MSKYLIFIRVIRLKEILLEGMSVDVANAIFSKFGVKSASQLDKGRLKDYYVALVKKHHPDTGGKDENMRDINAAYDVLKTIDSSHRLPPPSDIWPGHKTYPKDPRTKEMLKRIVVTFHFSKDNSIIDSLKVDYFDLVRILHHLKNMPDIEIENWEPMTPFDTSTNTWLTDKLKIYLAGDETKIRSAVRLLKLLF